MKGEIVKRVSKMWVEKFWSLRAINRHRVLTCLKHFLMAVDFREITGGISKRVSKVWLENF
jgi:chemotaxis regulatin CheY-phosphate phosphatase CheZ